MAKYTASQIADWFLARVDREAGDSITHLKLQKLVYYAQAWALALLGEPLFDEDLQAWTHGPVVRSLFERFKGNGWEALCGSGNAPKLDKKTKELLDEVFRVYGEHGAKTLERLSHCEAPWKEARGDCAPEERCENIISKESIQTFYREKYRAAIANGEKQ